MKAIIFQLFLIISSHSFVFSQHFRIKFEYEKSALTSDEFKNLDELATRMTKSDMKQYHIQLHNFACEEELINNKGLGALRAIEIIDYMEKKHKIPREKFYYIDSHPKRINEKKCKGDITGIEIILI